MIFFDTETTGLITNESLPLEQQPRIIEIGALLTDIEGTNIREFSTLVNPGMQISEEITKITGITNDDLAGAPSFAEVVPALADFFLCENVMLAHHSRFDHMMLVFELQRLDKQWNFPWPWTIIDTKTLYAGKLANWAREVKGDDFVQTHRAIDDCRLLRDCWKSPVRR